MNFFGKYTIWCKLKGKRFAPFSTWFFAFFQGEIMSNLVGIMLDCIVPPLSMELCLWNSAPVVLRYFKTTQYLRFPKKSIKIVKLCFPIKKKFVTKKCTKHLPFNLCVYHFRFINTDPPIINYVSSSTVIDRFHFLGVAFLQGELKINIFNAS